MKNDAPTCDAQPAPQPEAIRSERPGHTTTIWSDGEVYRTDHFGRVERRSDINPTHFTNSRDAA